MKERTQELPASAGLKANGAAGNVVEQSPEARGLSQTMRDPARRKRTANRKMKDRCSSSVRKIGDEQTGGAGREASSLKSAPNGAEASGKRNGRKISGTGKAASDDANGATAAGDATSAATCTVREAYAEVAEPGPNAAVTIEESGSVDDRRPRAPDDLEMTEAEIQPEAETRMTEETDEPLALDAPGFVDEMHSRVNLYGVMRDLLQAGDLKVKQRAAEYLLEMKYGKGVAVAVEEPPRIDFGDLPRPKR